jgi:hypothetical protein
MQLADWLFTLLALRSDDPPGRTALDVTLPSPTQAPRPATPQDRPTEHV